MFILFCLDMEARNFDQHTLQVWEDYICSKQQKDLLEILNVDLYSDAPDELQEVLDALEAGMAKLQPYM